MFGGYNKTCPIVNNAAPVFFRGIIDEKGNVICGLYCCVTVEFYCRVKRSQEPLLQNQMSQRLE
jgi:hypothetical protein